MRFGSFVVVMIPWFGVFGHDERAVPEGGQPAPMPLLGLAPGGVPMGVCGEYEFMYWCCLDMCVHCD